MCVYECVYCTYLVVKFRQVQLHFVSLEVMILCLFAHRRNQVKLSRYRVRLLTDRQADRQAERQTDRQRDRETDRERETGETDVCTI